MKTYSGAADPRADHVLARSEQINNSAEVGEGGLSISNGGGTDGVGRGSTSGGGVASIDVIVTSSDSNVNTTSSKL